ncbi:MAG: hypothetical protein KIS84_05555 [Dokdonella sp.]|nr:hypothetical protein [Dokdonella sp.]
MASLAQTLILTAVALVALGFAVRRLLPGTSTRMLAGVAGYLDAPGRSRFSRWLGARLRPARAAGGCGSGDGCGGCGGCGSTDGAKAKGDAQPLVFTSRKRP